MKKKMLAMFLALVLVGTQFVGCGNSAGSDEEKEKNTVEQEETKKEEKKEEIKKRGIIFRKKSKKLKKNFHFPTLFGKKGGVF